MDRQPMGSPLWPERIFGLLAIVEVAAIFVFLVVGSIRLVHYAVETQWTFHGVLPLLNENWKGALIIGALLFYRTLHLALARSAAFYDVLRRNEVKPSGPVRRLTIPKAPEAKR